MSQETPHQTIVKALRDDGLDEKNSQRLAIKISSRLLETMERRDANLIFVLHGELTYGIVEPRNNLKESQDG